MQTVADLNARADAVAALYDGIAFLSAETPGEDDENVVPGGEVQAVSFTPAGDEGPTSDHGAVDGVAWSSLVPATLDGVATHVALYVGGEFRCSRPMSVRLGPGVVSYSLGFTA